METFYTHNYNTHSHTRTLSLVYNLVRERNWPRQNKSRTVQAACSALNFWGKNRWYEKKKSLSTQNTNLLCTESESRVMSQTIPIWPSKMIGCILRTTLDYNHMPISTNVCMYVCTSVNQNEGCCARNWATQGIFSLKLMLGPSIIEIRMQVTEGQRTL